MIARWMPAALAIVALTAACSPASPMSQSTGGTSSRANEDSSRPSSGIPGAPAIAPPAPTAAAARPAANSGGGEPAMPTDQAVVQLRRIIYTGVISLEAGNPLEVAENITKIVKEAGGYVATSSTSYQGENQVASLSLRVPADAYQDVLNGIQRSADKVRDQKTTSQDVSEEFADVEAQVRNLRATEAQYLIFLQKAATIDEVLKVQGQLTTVRGQIERLQGRLNYLERRSDMATIDVQVFPPAVKPKTNPPTTYANPIEAAVAAWDASLRFLAVGASAVLSVVVFFWWAIPPLALLVYWLRSRVNRRRPTPIVQPTA